MIEVEIKAKVDDHKKLEVMFLENHGHYVCSLIHEDTYFNMPKKLRNFYKTDEALRIRKSETYDKRNSQEEAMEKNIIYYLTYKGAKLDSTTKTREEIETTIEDGNKLLRILEILGFRKVLTVKKRRELYDFKFKNYKIEALIDYLPILDEYFIEVELVTDSLDNLDTIRAQLFEFLAKFGIDEKDSIRKSYLELIINKNRLHS